MPPRNDKVTQPEAASDGSRVESNTIARFIGNSGPIPLAGKRVLFGISVANNKRCEGEHLESMLRYALIEGAYVTLLIADSVQEENLLRQEMTSEEKNEAKRMALEMGRAWLQRNLVHIFNAIQMLPHPNWDNFNETNREKFISQLASDIPKINDMLAAGLKGHKVSHDGKVYKPSLGIIKWDEIESMSLLPGMVTIHQEVFSNAKLNGAIHCLAEKFTKKPKSQENSSAKQDELELSKRYIAREMRAVCPFILTEGFTLFYPGTISEPFVQALSAYRSLLSQASSASATSSFPPTEIGEVKFDTVELGAGHKKSSPSNSSCVTADSLRLTSVPQFALGPSCIQGKSLTPDASDSDDTSSQKSQVEGEKEIARSIRKTKKYSPDVQAEALLLLANSIIPSLPPTPLLRAVAQDATTVVIPVTERATSVPQELNIGKHRNSMFGHQRTESQGSTPRDANSTEALAASGITSWSPEVVKAMAITSVLTAAGCFLGNRILGNRIYSALTP